MLYAPSFSMNASQFVDRFVIAYWDDVANTPSEFADHSDPCEESLEELLADVTVDWSQNTPEHLRIEMSNTIGDAWRFVFADNRGTWVLKTATSGSLPDINRVDLLDSTYNDYFRPFLDRVIANAQRDG